MVLPVLPYYTAAKALQTDEGKRIAGGIVEQSIIRGPVELFRTMKDMVGEDIDRQLEPAYGPRLKKKDSTAARIQQEAKTEETIKRILLPFAGKENIGQTQMGYYADGTPKMVTTVKRPETLVGGITRDVGAFAADFIALGKVTKPIKAYEWYKKFKKAKPKSAGFAEFTARAEAAAQLTIDPYRHNLANFIGDFIADDNEGFLGDVEKYLLDPLKSSQEKTQAENRIGLLAEGLVISGLLYGGYLSIKGTHAYIKNNKEDLVDVLKDLRTKGKDVKEEFVNIIKNRLKGQEPNIIALSRQKRAESIEALKPPKYSLSRFVTGTNFQFSESRILRYLESKRLRTFTARGHMPPEMFERFLKSENVKSGWHATIEFAAKDLDDALHSISYLTTKFKNKKTIVKQVNKVLFTDFRVPTIQTVSKTGKGKQTTLGRTQAATFEKELRKLPKSLHEPIRQARLLQDDITRLWIESPVITKSQREVFANNLGVYFKKVYKLYDQGKIPWFKVRRDLEDYYAIELKRENSKLSELEAVEQAKAKVAGIIESGTGANILRSAYAELRKLNPKEYSQRVYLPQELKAVLNPVDKPVDIIINSTKKTADFLEDLKFYKQEWKAGENSYLWEEPTNVFRYKIKEGFGDLSGKYTTKELRNYLTEDVDALFFDNWLWKGMLTLKVNMQKNATIYSLLTNIKNFGGMNQMSFMSGINPYKNTKKVFNTLKTQFKKSTKEQQEWFIDRQQRGLIGKNTVLGDIKGLTTSLGKKSIQGYIWNLPGIKQVDRFMTKFYQSVDDWGKLNMFEVEIENITKVQNALPKGAKFNKYRLTEEQIKDKAGLLVRDNMPNYDMIPRFWKRTRQIPAIGAFFSFSAESLRNTLNAAGHIAKDFNSARKLLLDGATEAAALQSARASKRAAGFAAMVGGAEGIRRVVQDINGISDAEYEAAQKFLPTYFQDAWIWRNKDGELVAFNYGTWDATNYPKITTKFIHEMAEAAYDDEDQSISKMLKDYIFPYLERMGSSFIGPSMSQQVLNQYFLGHGVNNAGATMRNPFDSTDRVRIFKDPDGSISNLDTYLDRNNLKILLLNLTYKLPPFTPDVRRARDYYRTRDFDQTNFEQDRNPLTRLFIGASYHPLNNEYLANQYERKARAFTKVKGNYDGNLHEGTAKELTFNDFLRNYIDENAHYTREYQEFSKFTHAAQLLGLPVRDILVKAGVAQADRNLYFTSAGRNRILDSTIQNVPLGFSSELGNLKKMSKLEIKLRAEMPRVSFGLDEIEAIRHVDEQYAKIPLLRNPDDRKDYPTIKEVKEELMERYGLVVGGLVEGQEVPYAKEYPEERINPFTGEPYTALYYNTTQRKPVNEGGILEKAGQTVKSLYDTTRAIGNIKSPENVLVIIDSRSKYLSDQLYNPTEEQQQQVMDYTREQWSEHKRQQSLMENELDELGNYRMKLLSEHPQNTVETIKDKLSSGLQQSFLNKFSKFGGAGPAIGLGGGRIIEGELADIEIAESYQGETPLLPSIYEPKALPSPPETKFLGDLPSESGLRALDLSESGEFSQLERNIKAGQKKGTIGQLINQAINKGRVTDEELKDLGLFGQTEWWGEDIGATKTTQEQLLEQMQERAARTKTEIRGDEAEDKFTPVMEQSIPVDEYSNYPGLGEDEPLTLEREYPIWFQDIDGIDHSLMDMGETLDTINQALANPEQADIYLIGIANEFKAILKYEEETGESLGYSPSEFGDMDQESVARYNEIREQESIMSLQKKNFSPTELDGAIKFLQGLEANEIEELVETKSRMDYVTGDPYRKIVFEEYPDTYMVGNEDVGFSLTHNNTPFLNLEDIFTYNQAEVELRNYIRDNVDEAPFSTTTGSRPAQWRDQGTLPLMKDYEELTVIAEQPPSVAYGSMDQEAYGNVEGEHGMGENSIGHVQLSTRELGDGLDTTHIEAIQSDLIQSGEGGYLPYQKGWRAKVFRETIDRAIANGTNRVSWSPAWIQDMHWKQGTAIHNVADIELLAEVKKLEKEYGATFSFEEIVIDSKDYGAARLGGGSSIDLATMSDIIEKGVNQWTIRKWIDTGAIIRRLNLEGVQIDEVRAGGGARIRVAEQKEIDRLIKQGRNKVTKVEEREGTSQLKVLDEELRIKPTGSSVSSENIELAGAPFRRDVGTIKVQVPTLTFNEKAVSKWTRLGRRKYLQGGKAERVGVETDYGSTKVEDEDIKTLLKGSLALLQPSNDISLEDIQKSKLSLWSGPDKFPIEEDIFMNNLMPLLKTKQGNMASSTWRNHEALIPLSEAAIRDYLYPQEKSRYNKQYSNYPNAHSTKTAMKAMSRHLQQERDRQKEGMNPTKLADILNIPFDKAAEFASSLLSRQD